MEQHLFITAVVAFAFDRISKYFIKKNHFENNFKFALWNSSFALIAGILVFYILNFMASNGATFGLSKGTFSLILLITLGYICFNYIKAKKADKQAKDKIIAFNLDWAQTIYFAAFFASIVMFFFLQAFRIPSASMRNTLLEGDNLFVNKAYYGMRLPFVKENFVNFNEIQRGDIIIFRFPAEDREQSNCGEPQYGRDFVKRVIALPGEKVEVKDQTVYINDKELPLQEYAIFAEHDKIDIENPLTEQEYQKSWEDRKLEKYFGISLRDSFGPVIVPEGQYFAMGDNRDFSCDSRFWGPVPKENIKGKAWLLHWPLNRFRIIK